MPGERREGPERNCPRVREIRVMERVSGVREEKPGVSRRGEWEEWGR
jgi:hypothetical protein